MLVRCLQFPSSQSSVPLVEKLDASNLLSHLLGQDLVARDGLDFDFSAVRHDCNLTVKVLWGEEVGVRRFKIPDAVVEIILAGIQCVRVVTCELTILGIIEGFCAHPTLSSEKAADLDI